LQSLCCTSHWARLNILRGSQADRPCQVYLLLGTETNNNHLIKRLVVILQCNIDWSIAYLNSLSLKTDIRDFQSRTWGCVQREVTIEVGNRTALLTLHLYRSTNDWLATPEAIAANAINLLDDVIRFTFFI